MAFFPARRALPESGRGLRQRGRLPGDDRCVLPWSLWRLPLGPFHMCYLIPQQTGAELPPLFLTEDKGVDLGQKANPYFYSCCHH